MKAIRGNFPAVQDQQLSVKISITVNYGLVVAANDGSFQVFDINQAGRRRQMLVCDDHCVLHRVALM